MSSNLINHPAHAKLRRHKVETRRVSEIDPQPIQWLWQPHFALGKLSMLVGDPGLSKSTLAACIAAHVTMGREWPGGVACPSGEVVLINAEDDPADTIRPRLDAASADPSRVHLLESIADSQRGASRPFNLADVDVLGEFLECHPDVRVVVIDPVSAYVSGIDSHKNSDVRSLLAPLAALAAKRRVAFLVVSHLNKGQASAIYRSSGSLAFVAAARSVYVIAKDPDVPEQRLMLPIKNNLGPDTAGVRYALKIADGGVPYVKWLPGAVEISAEEALRTGSEDERSATQDCAEWLADVLAKGPAKAGDVYRSADEIGFTRKVLRRAREKLAVETRKSDFSDGWIWSL